MTTIFDRYPAETISKVAFGLDSVLARKAAPKNPNVAYLLIESRVYRTLARSWKAHAVRGISGATSFIANSTGPLDDYVSSSAKKIIDAEMTGWSQATTPVITSAVSAAYQESKKWGMRRLFGGGPPAVPIPREVVRKEDEEDIIPDILPASALRPFYGYVDSVIVEALKRIHVYWIGTFYEQKMSERLGSIISFLVTEMGLGREEAAAEVERVLRIEMGITSGELFRPDGLQIPSGFKGTPRDYFQTVAAEIATRSRIFGAIQTFREAGVTSYTIRAMNDERTCVMCLFMDGKVFTIKQGAELIGKMVRATTPEAFKAASPWLSYKQAVALTGVEKYGQVSEEDAQALADFGLALPSYHGKCRCTVDISKQFIQATYPEGPDRGPIP